VIKKQTQTGHVTPSVAVGGIYIAIAAMRPKISGAGIRFHDVYNHVLKRGKSSEECTTDK